MVLMPVVIEMAFLLLLHTTSGKADKLNNNKVGKPAHLQ